MREDQVPKVRPSTALVTLAFAAIYILWGSSYLAIRFAVETLPPLLMTGVRSVMAGILLAAIFGTRRIRSCGWTQWKAAAASGALLFVGCHGLLGLAERTVDSGTAALMLATIPGWMVAFSYAADRRLPGGKTVVGLLLSFAGAAAMFESSAAGAGPDSTTLGLLLLGAACWAAGSIYTRQAPLPDHAGVSAAMQLVCGGVLLLITGVLAGEVDRVDFAQVSLRSGLSLAYLILFGSVVSFTAYNWLLRVTSPAAVGSYALVNPVVALLLGWLVAEETLDIRVGVAAVVVIAGVALIHSERRRPTYSRDARLLQRHRRVFDAR